MATSTVDDVSSVADWSANLAAQGRADADLLARIAVDLGLGPEEIGADGNADGNLIALLGAELLFLLFDRAGEDDTGEPVAFSVEGDRRGLAVRAGVERVLRLCGQEVTLTHGGSGSTVRARVSVMATGTKYAWFTSGETSAWLSPAWVVTLAHDSPAAVGDTVVLSDGHTYTVRKVDRPKVGGITIKTTLFVART